MVNYKQEQTTKQPEKQAIRRNSMSPATGKNKQEKRLSPSSSAVDLRLAKEPDPWANAKWHIRKWLAAPLTLSKLVQLAERLDKDQEWSIGNEQFLRIADIDPEKRVDWCSRYDMTFKSDVGIKTPLGLVDELYKYHKYDTQAVFEFIIKSLEKEKPTKGWYVVRELVFQLSQQLPSELFCLEEAATESALFWNLSDPTEKELRTSSPLVQFWVISTNLMGHPWVSEYTSQRDTGKCTMLPLDDYSEGSMSDMFGDDDEDEFQQGKLAGSGQANDSDEESDEEMQESTTSGTKRAPHQEGSLEEPFQLLSLTTSPDSKRLKTAEAIIGPNELRKEEVHVETVMSEDEQDSKASKGRENEEDEKFRMFDEAPTRVVDDGRVSGVSNYESDEEDDDFRNLSPYKPPANQSYADKARAPAEEQDRPIKPLGQIIKELRQVNMEGLSGKCHIFEVTFAITWNGAQGGRNLPKAWLDHVLEVLSDALKSSDHGLAILPIRDEAYWQVNTWARNEAQLRRLIPDTRALRKYLDFDYGNMSYAFTSTKAGDKKLTTRIRVNFNERHAPQVIMRFLHDGLQEFSMKAECQRSPLQRGSIARIGFLLFYPFEINVRTIERELMRHLEYQRPLGLKWEWVQTPYDFRTSWDDRDPGIQRYHLYCERQHSREVDYSMRQWLHPDTPKKDIPYGAVTTYVSDWRSTQQGLTSITPHAMEKDQFLRLLTKGKDCRALSTTMFADCLFPGMLRSTTTRLFGDSMLLKILLAIKATPAAVEATQENDEVSVEDNSSQQGKDEEISFIKVTKKKNSKKKGSKSELDEIISSVTPDSMTKGQRKAEANKVIKLKKDEQNLMPGPLFLMILPGATNGTYVFYTRLKYQQLARNVLQGLVPFLLYHLNEGKGRGYPVLSKWFSNETLKAAKRKSLQWCTDTAQALRAGRANSRMDSGFDWLEFGADITDAWRGTLSIDMNMANVKDLDDGATVIGAMEAFLHSQQQLQQAESALKETKSKLHDKEEALLEQSKLLLAAEQREAALQAELDEIKRVFGRHTSGIPQSEQTETGQLPPAETANPSTPKAKEPQQDEGKAPAVTSPPSIMNKARPEQQTPSTPKKVDFAAYPPTPLQKKAEVTPETTAGTRGAAGSTGGP